MILNFEKYINESINDELKLKVLFLCGLPNSGKSTMINKISYIPFQNIDMDKYLKLFANKQGLDLDLRNGAPNIDKKTEIRIKSRDLSVTRMHNAINSLLAIVIDGTGRDSKLMLEQKSILEDKGYDTAMLYMDIDLETALKRNSLRERKVPEQVIIDAHNNLVENLIIYKKRFKNFWILNSEKDSESDIKKVEKDIRKFFYAPVENPIGKYTLLGMEKRKFKYLSDYNKK